MLNKAMAVTATDRFVTTHILTVGSGYSGSGGNTCGYRSGSMGSLSPSTLGGNTITELSSHDITSSARTQNIWVELNSSLGASYLYLVLEDAPKVVYKIPQYYSNAYQITGSPVPTEGLFITYVGRAINIYLSTEPPDF